MSSTITALTSGGGLAMAGDTSGQLELKTNNGTTAVTIDTSQNVGIGVTANSSNKLQVAGDITTSWATDKFIGMKFDTGTSYKMGLMLKDSSRECKVWSQSVDSDDKITFYTGSTPSERMRITSAGNILAGTSTVYDNALLTLQKSVSSSSIGGGTITNIYNSGAASTTRLYNTVLRVASNSSSADCNIVITDNTAYNYFFGGNAGTLYCLAGTSGGVGLTQGATSWSSLSDATLKNVTGTYTTALADIAEIEPVKFTWKSDTENKPQVGVLAQSVQKVVPEAVNTDDEGILSVRYTDMIPLLIASIQELNAKVDAQALEIQALKGVA